jgi:hypothetical protein
VYGYFAEHTGLFEYLLRDQGASRRPKDMEFMFDLTVVAESFDLFWKL